MARIWPVALAAVALTAAAAAMLALQDSLVKTLITPGTPFQVAMQPPPPRYDDASRAAWLLWPDTKAAAGAKGGTRDETKDGADIFYVHSTTYYSAKRWNAPWDEPAAAAEAQKIAAPNEVGPFAAAARIFAPHYRQATLFAQFTQKFDGVEARRLAYDDVRRAFAEYLRHADPEHPLVLAGYEQGGLYVLGLLHDYVAKDRRLRARLAAAYVIDHATSLATDAPMAPPCASPQAIRCVVSYVEVESRFRREARRLRERSMRWDAMGRLVPMTDEALLCVNPLTWSLNDNAVPPRAGRGAAIGASPHIGDAPRRYSDPIAAECSDGVLLVPRPAEAALRRRDFGLGKWRAKPFNLFYDNLAADAARRIRLTHEKMRIEAENLDPIDQTVDITESPIHKVPY